jgi:ATP-dependent helicase YprA (DUF1998 family)
MKIDLKHYSLDGKLLDADDAKFVARIIKGQFFKIGEICWDGIIEISDEYLDVIFEGILTEDLGPKMTGMAEEVSGAFSRWVDHQKSQNPEDLQRDAKTTTQKRIERKQAPPLKFTATNIEGERYTPTRLASRLKSQLTSYIESSYPLSDPVLVRARRNLLNEVHEGKLLAQEPYIETTPRYASHSGGYLSLGLPERTAEFFELLSRTRRSAQEEEGESTLLFPGIYKHQASAFTGFLGEGKDVIVATGTGSGKTECFLVPMLGAIYQEACERPLSYGMPGVRALVLYPMNALVNDQLSRLRNLLGDPAMANAFHDVAKHSRHPQFGMYTGRTPYPGPRNSSKDGERVAPILEYYLNMEEELERNLRNLGRYPAKDLVGFYGKSLEEECVYASGKKAGKAYKKHHWDERLHTQPGDRELFTRQEMVSGSGSNPGRAPDVLVTNYSMLEYMLVRPFERPIFAETREWLAQDGNQFLLVVDEAHMYRGAQGAEVGFLLRRLRARLGISEKSDKLRVICTSASVGSGEEAMKNIRNFAADLTGKKPSDFVAIEGVRDIPEFDYVSDKIISGILAKINLDDLHAAAKPGQLRIALDPIFQALGKTCKSDDENGILKHLYDVLEGTPLINCLLKETAGTARSLSSLANAMFPGHTNGNKAVEVLVTLGAIARKQEGEPGLVPTRVHAMFRGLHALYACVNPMCCGRQDSPGKEAMLGKLFAEPITTCDACGSRVFEIASCRSCGSPYLLGYCPENEFQKLDFVWGETEGDLQQFHLLPAPPRYVQACEEVRFHMTTGYLDLKHSFPDAETRSLWLALDASGQQREPLFPLCAMCQPPGTRTHGRINDFRTKGEQPFTALIEAQFAEQPPQKNDERLPNRGRKVLVFSDGRQKAARLAPALEHSHARDLFRQVLALASHELKEQTECQGMDKIYPAVIWVCNDRGINLFPSPEEREFRQQFNSAKGKSLNELITKSNQGYLKATESYAVQLYAEMTDRYYSLNSLGLATIEEDPLIRSAFETFPEIGLKEGDIFSIFRDWVRLQLEARRFLPPGADLSKFGDEPWERPDGIDPDNANHIFPAGFDEYLTEILPEPDALPQIKVWFKTMFRESGMFEFQNDRYFLRPLGLSLRLRMDDAWLRCRDCSRLYVEAINSKCPFCLGTVIPAEAEYLDSRTGFYRNQLRHAFDRQNLEPFGLTAAEHTAQLTGYNNDTPFNKTEEYELRFQDIFLKDEPPIDVLSCTTTMEVGIDIGSLSGVALRNVPPQVSNYQQRSGRAGRRGRSVASVVTYAHGSSHDSYYYSQPERIISGAVLAPIVYIENQQILSRHINAYLLQRFFHSTVPSTGENMRLFEALGTVEQFLSDLFPCSLPKLREWLNGNRELLENEITAWAPRQSFGFNEEIEVDGTISAGISGFIHALETSLPAEDYGRRETLEGVARESLEKVLIESLLDVLLARAVLPRYAFPTDVVAFWVAKRKQSGDPAYKRVFDYEPSRDLQIALSEYAPGSSLTIDKWRFTSDALFSPYEPEVASVLDKREPYTACANCGWISLLSEASVFVSCPICASDDLHRQSFVVPSGFAPDINEKKQIDRGDLGPAKGETTKAQLEIDEPPDSWDVELYDGRISLLAKGRRLVKVNKGIGNRGFMICPDCGRAEPSFGPGFTKPKLLKDGMAKRHLNPLDYGVTCDGNAQGPFFLGHRFPTDVLLFRIAMTTPMHCPTTLAPAKAALTSLVEAVSLAASRALQIDEGELSGNWTPVAGTTDVNAVAYFFLYDLLPGGAGYTRLVKQELEKVLDEAEKLLSGCDCVSSCYQCLRHYRNNYIHASLDRHLALALLRYVRYGTLPTVSYAELTAAIRPLLEFAKLKDIKFELNANRGVTTIPLIVRRDDDSEVWVEVRHPLIDNSACATEIRRAAQDELVEYCHLDSYTLVHDLPSAVRELQI